MQFVTIYSDECSGQLGCIGSSRLPGERLLLTWCRPMLYADVACVVWAFVFHVLDGVFAWRCHQAGVLAWFGGRSQRNERVSGSGCIEHLNNSERNWRDLGSISGVSLITEKIPKN